MMLTQGVGARTLSWVLLSSFWTFVNSQPSLDEFHGHTAADDGTLLWFDGEEPANLSSWEWETHGAAGRTWHWDGDNGTSWTTWIWSSTGPNDNHGGGFLLSSPLPPVKAGNGKSEAQTDSKNNCNPCGGAAWALNGPVLTWTTPPESDNFFNFSNWMMQQGSDCWGFTSKPLGWGFVFENVTVEGDKGGPGDGACAFPSVTFSHPSVHTHGIGPGLGGIGGFASLGGLGFGGVGGFGGFGSFGGFHSVHGGSSGFGFRGVGSNWGGSGFSHGFVGLGGLGGCPYSGYIARRRRDTEEFDDTTEGVDGGKDSKPTWGIRRWLMKARDFLMSIAQASQDDEGKGGWTIPLGSGFIQVGPNLLRKVSGWVGGAVLTVLGGNPVDPETQVAIETILLDPHVIEVVRNATEHAIPSADAS